MGITYTTIEGLFAFHFTGTCKTLISNSTIIPEYKFYSGENFITTKVVSYSPELAVIVIGLPIEGVDQLIVNGNVSLDNGYAAAVARVELWNNEEKIVASTRTDQQGKFTLCLLQPFSQQLINGEITQFKIWANDTLLKEENINYTSPEDEIGFVLNFSAYNTAANKSFEQSFLISGTVTTNEGTLISNTRLRCENVENPHIRTIGSTTTNENGELSSTIIDTTAFWISNASVNINFILRFGNNDITVENVEGEYSNLTLIISQQTYDGVLAQAPDRSTVVEEITNLRTTISETKQSLLREKESLKIAEFGLKYAAERKLSTAQYLTAINTHSQNIAVLENALHGHLLAEEDWLHDARDYFLSHPGEVAQLDDHVPILFFPVRIETVFQEVGTNKELWVRIFPDDIAVDTHEQDLTDDEITTGQEYWKSYVSATNQTEKVQAWDVLSRSYKAQRGAWVALQTTPTNLSSNPNASNLIFPSLTPKSESWTKQPLTRIMPDAFIINGYMGANFSAPAFSVQTNYLTDEIKVGIDPNSSTDVFDQQNGNIVSTDPEIDWMLDFDAAVAKGLGKKISLNTTPLNQAWNSGFSRIIVLGVKTSLTKEDSQLRLEELINAHHYTDGFSLLKQGTSTNNTDTAYSGYSSVDLGNVVTHATEREGDLFAPVVTNSSKMDGQIFCEALGIEYNPLYNIFHSNGYDIRDAMSINNALYQASWGQYLGNMWFPKVKRKHVDDLRHFFSDYVRSRGALPSIRSGIQPYGILPVSVYSRMNWSNDPYADLYTKVRDLTGILDATWANVLTDTPLATVESTQDLINILSQSPISTEYIQRLGVGSNYIWNNLKYSSNSESEDIAQNWLDEQLVKMTELEDVLGEDMNPRPRISQINFLENFSSVNRPLVADENSPKDKLLDYNSGFNYLTVLRNAQYRQIRDINFEDEGFPEDFPQTILFQYARQSLLLEYFDAAYKLLGISDDERVEPELINVNQDSETFEWQQENDNFRLYMGGSPWHIMEQPFQGYATIADFLDSSDGLYSDAASGLLKAKYSLADLAGKSVRELETLTAELIDVSSYRLDSWRLALVNQRLNAIRGIVDGSSNRNKGIFLGAYGWVENVTRNQNLTLAQAPTSNFTGTIYDDGGNLGFIHAPSLNQAATAAVLRSGFETRANSSPDSPLSVNISSERVRSALQVLEGIKNGQELPVLLGYEFERRLHDLYSPSNNYYTDQYIVPLRLGFPLSNTISLNTPPNTPVEYAASRNVVNGVKLIEAYKNGLSSNPSDPANPILTTAAITNISAIDKQAIINEILWIWNIMDATGDVSTAESVFNMVQGNQARAGAITEAISRGNNIPDIQHLSTPKTGLGVNQRMTMQLQTLYSLPTPWDGIDLSARALAEPYINNWIAQLLGSVEYRCKVTNHSTQTDSEIKFPDLNIQAIDLVYMINDELKSDESELSLRIKKVIRDSEGLPPDDILEIKYDEVIDAGAVPIGHITSLLRYLKTAITTLRHLKTTDYIIPTEADGVLENYDLNDFYNRLNDAYNALDNAKANLITTNNNFTGATGQFQGMRDALYALSSFGIEQTIFQYSDETEENANALTANANSVIKEVQKRQTEYSALSNLKYGTTLIPSPGSLTNTDDYVTNCIEGFKIIFGRAFNPLPKFQLRTQEATLLNSLLTTNYGTLLSDHTAHSFVVDEWVSGIAKVRKNVANYEVLSILCSAINIASFTTDRVVAPLQIPYANDNTERWLGASVLNDTALKDGRVAFGVSLPGVPNAYSFSGWQVGFMVDEWIDVIPNKKETTSIAFHYNQPNAKPPQCLLLGLTPDITGNWQWNDLVDMINETFDMAKKRALTYEHISQTYVGHLGPAMYLPVTSLNSLPGLMPQDFI